MRDRSGYAANMALLRRAAALSVDEYLRTDRLLAAADAALTAARPDQPPDLLAQGGLGDEHPLRGVGEVTLVGQGHEIRRKCLSSRPCGAPGSAWEADPVPPLPGGLIRQRP